jgi:dolichol-phosphate mannosyltransferase
MRERARFMRGMVSWVGFRSCRLEYVRQERYAGETKYPVRKMLKFATDGLLAFSMVPLKLASLLGFLCSGFSVLGIAWGLVIRFFYPARAVPGWTSLLVAVVFLGGVQLICLGIIGEYLARVYDEVRNRPLYVCDEEVNLGE